MSDQAPKPNYGTMPKPSNQLEGVAENLINAVDDAVVPASVKPVVEYVQMPLIKTIFSPNTPLSTKLLDGAVVLISIFGAVGSALFMADINAARQPSQ